MEITHNNQQYSLDVERAIQLGVLKQEITPKSGDVLKSKSGGNYILFIQRYDNKWDCFGYLDSLRPYSNVETTEQIKHYYTDSDWVFQGQYRRWYCQIDGKSRFAKWLETGDLG